jgi:hypothetical protein
MLILKLHFTLTRVIRGISMECDIYIVLKIAQYFLKIEEIV